MKVTLDIAPDILETAEKISAKTGYSIGEVISELVRMELRSPDSAYAEIANGIEILPSSRHAITPEFVRQFMKAENA